MNIRKIIQNLLLSAGLFLFASAGSAFAANEGTVSGGTVGSLPTVGAASTSISDVTLTDTVSVDVANGDVVKVLINTASYGAVAFDTSVTTVSLGGSCGYFGAAYAVTYAIDDTVASVTLGSEGACAIGDTIVVSGLKVKTLYAQAAPGDNALVKMMVSTDKISVTAS